MRMLVLKIINQEHNMNMILTPAFYILIIQYSVGYDWDHMSLSGIPVKHNVVEWT